MMMIPFTVQDIDVSQRLASSHHVYDIHAYLHKKLLWYYYPQSQLLSKRLLAQFMVPVKTFTGHHLMHLYHLPQGEKGDDP